MTSSNNILQHLIELIGNVCDAYTCALFMIESDKKTLVMREHFTLSHNLDIEAKIAIGKGPIGLAAQTRKPQLIENLNQNTRFLGIYKKNEDLKSFIALPVIFADQVAVMAIDTKERYQFPIKVQKILSEFTQQVGWSLESKTPTISPSDQPVLQEINYYCRFLAESPDRSSIANRLTHIPASLIPCPAIAVIWFEENLSEGRIISHRGFANDLSKVQVHLGRGLVGSCAKNKSPLFLQIHEDRKSVIFSEDEKPEGLKCAAALPIQHNDSLYGVLLVGSIELDGISHNDLDKLALIVSAAASALFCADTKDRWIYDKNLDPITGVPNHRFLAEYHLSLSEEVFKSKEPVFFLTFHITNIAELYEVHGIDHGDAYLKQAMTLFSNIVPSPKFVFRLSESCFLILLMQRSEKDADLLKSKLKKLLACNPLYVNGVSMQAEFQWGLSTYPEEGKELFHLINLSRNRLSQKAKAMA
jgi:diguanylate cyclase (GGDEF)-like protein